jgi:Ca2+-binding EF-hand superfamily protein
MRFAAMDRNTDGVITRTEWQGSDRSFEVHDWNGDGVLSKEEVRPGARRPDQPPPQTAFDSSERDYEFQDWTARGFEGLDHNRDGRVTRDEWHFEREGFGRADHNGDNAISRQEFLQGDDDDREDRFVDLDTGGDGFVSRAEWHGTRERFDLLDDNRDGRLSYLEIAGPESKRDLFASLDVNRNDTISRDEWHWARGDFDRLDLNRDDRITRAELAGTATAPARQSQAYRAGYDRGIAEGRLAGRGDLDNRAGWDLDGQRELETADSGYTPAIGAREEYQAGYREGFRRGYPEGFGRK